MTSGKGVYARASIAVAHKIELFEKGLLAQRKVNSLFRHAAKIVNRCKEGKMQIDSLNLPEEVRAKLESLRVEVPECLASVFGWVSLMPSNKEMLQQSLLATLKANADPRKKLANRSGGDCGDQDVKRTVKVADATTFTKDQFQWKVIEVQIVF